MKIRFLNQPKEVKLSEILIERISEKFDKIWIVAGFAKDTGLEMLLSSFEEAIKNGTTVELIIGVDNKNISKDMLSKLLNMGCKVRFHINKEESKFETRMYAFERESGDSYVYVSGSKLSEGGLTENKCLVTEIVYDENEKKEFNKAKIGIENGANYTEMEELDTARLKTLAENGEVVARITERKIPRISDIYKVENINLGVQEYDEGSGIDIKESINEDLNIEIDFPAATEITYQSSLGGEVEHVIKKKEKENSEEEKVSSKMILGEKELNYETMNTFIIQTNKVVQTGVTSGEIKIPSYIAENMNNFLDYPEMFHIIEDSKGKLKDTAIVKFKIYDNKIKDSNLIDEKVKVYITEKYVAINSEVIKNLSVEEGDIIRIIKEEKGQFSCEIIRQNTAEYLVWEGFCTNKLKGTSRKFGIM
ncbi:MAG: hypothetical protein IKK43_02680 [Clostridia bacterium]|nr:hypothetical protein [Clostridia bacterium]